MKNSKMVFQNYVKALFDEDTDRIIAKFEKYHNLLQSANKKINLVSRQTFPAEYWVLHYLDSILIAPQIDNKKARILDFGTGAGLPGIPLKIVFPELEIHFLDATRKKISFLRNVCKKLDLNNCFTIVSRFEEWNPGLGGYFDLIVSRSVRILPDQIPLFFNLLKPRGKIFLYKSKHLKDADWFEKSYLIDVSHPALGIRKIIEICKQ